MSRKPYTRLTAELRMAVRYTWFIYSPPVPLSMIAKHFGITERTISAVTYRCGFTKSPDMFQGPAPGNWQKALLELYEKERTPGDDPTAIFAYFRAAKLGNSILRRYTKEAQHDAA